jgi:hypothetical protein
MSVERCDQHDLYYDTDLKLCCPLCEEAGVEEIVKLRDALTTSEKERVRWQKYYETGLKVDAELKEKLAQVTAENRNSHRVCTQLQQQLTEAQARCATLEAACSGLTIWGRNGLASLETNQALDGPTALKHLQNLIPIIGQIEAALKP